MFLSDHFSGTKQAFASVKKLNIKIVAQKDEDYSSRTWNDMAFLVSVF